jgi:hypothetical protein
MPKTWRTLAILLAFIYVLGCATQQPSIAEEKPAAPNGTAATADQFADAHLHLIDFLQNGAVDNRDGRFQGVGERGEIVRSSSVRYLSLPYGEQWRRLTLFLDDMDAAGVEYAMISGMPFLKKWSENEPFARPRYYLDSSSRMVLARDTDYLIATAFLDYQQEFADNKEELRKLARLHPFICGYDTTDLGAVDLVIKRIKEFPGVWHGIGEVMSRHDDLTNLTTGDRPRGNHPSLKRLCCFAGDMHLPVNIHHNIAPVSRNVKEVKEPVYLDELIELFEYCRPPNAQHETKFVWAHAGISRRVNIENLPYWLDVVLQRFEGQVHMDLSWVVYEMYIAKDLDAWARLVKKYPTSFMLGSDLVGSGEKLGSELRRYLPLLECISADPQDPVRRGLARDNFVNLMRGLGTQRRARMVQDGLISPDAPEWSGLILKPDYEYDEKAHTGSPASSFLLENRP